MKPYLRNAVEAALDELAAEKKVVIPRWVLLRAYGQERMSKSIWRDVQQRLEDEGVNPKSVQVLTSEASYTLVLGQHLSSLTEMT
jgi:hypothetical protein